MGYTFSKNKFDVEKNTRFSSEGSGFYRTLEQTNYWNSLMGDRQQTKDKSGMHDRPVPSTLPSKEQERPDDWSTTALCDIDDFLCTL